MFYGHHWLRSPIKRSIHKAVYITNRTLTFQACNWPQNYRQIMVSSISVYVDTNHVECAIHSWPNHRYRSLSYPYQGRSYPASPCQQLSVTPPFFILQTLAPSLFWSCLSIPYQRPASATVAQSGSVALVWIALVVENGSSSLCVSDDAASRRNQRTTDGT